MQKEIENVFTANPKTDKVYVTSDGQIFLNENLAKSHSIKIAGVRRKKALKYKVIKRVPETPVDETPVNETPVDETPVDETPVNETPVDETPVDETPVDEKKSRKSTKTKK